LKNEPRRVCRVARSKEQAKANYDRLSRWYDRLAGSAERRLRQRGLEGLGASEGEAVLEIGFGTGDALIALARAAGPSGRVCGIDLSDGMARVATAKLAAAGCSGVELHVGDAATLPFSDASFDAIFTSFTLELFDTPEIPVVLGECARVLRPDGRVVVVAMAKRGGLAERLYERLHRWFPVIIDCRPLPVPQTLRAAGFQVVAVHESTVWGLPVQVACAHAPSPRSGD
jgi:ubiquinone/menaquinone biosynthesis C-methylase UbiE